MKRDNAKWDCLYALAETHGGYFTAADAKALGYAYPHQHFHVKSGNWVRVDRGIFRLKHFPAVAHEDLIRWWLWSRKQGVISHESAAAVYELGDVLPPKTHLTVPQGFRKRASRAPILHRAQLDATDLEMREGFRITTPLRTILDLAREHLDPERLTAVTRDALKKGLIDRKALLDYLARMPKQIDPATQVTLQLAVRRAG
ncbi:MAG: type IV toxin-antitoxin system AbiEi family antitoxin domain-containing protein [Acidobacteriota bacterium]